MLGMKKRRCKLLWYGKGVVGVGVMLKEEQCEKVAEVRRESDGVRIVVVFEEDV